MEFVATMDTFQDSLLVSRPRDVFGFAVRYFQDEKAPNPEEAHAVHMLPFLIYNNQQFKSAACTIFCSFTNTDTNYKNYLDSATVCGILQRMKLDALGLQIKSIDELARARIMTLKRIDFNLFISCIRFPLACYQIVIWLQDRLLFMLEESNSEVSLLARSQAQQAQQSASTANAKNTAVVEDKSSSNVANVGYACLQQVPLRTVELHKIKQCLQKEQQLGYAKSSTRATATPSGIAANKYSSAYHKADHWSRHRSTCYHLHDCLALSSDADGTQRAGSGCGLALSESEQKMLNKLLTSTVDGLISSGGPNVVTGDVLVDSFMSRYLKHIPSASS